MTNDQIRRKIAEACGWTDVVLINERTPFIGGCLIGVKPKDKHHSRIPNYPECQDAMAEVLGTLTINEQEGYVRHLSSAVYEGSLWNLLAATPRQQAEAFLKAKGLWEEGE